MQEWWTGKGATACEWACTNSNNHTHGGLRPALIHGTDPIERLPSDVCQARARVSVAHDLQHREFL